MKTVQDVFDFVIKEGLYNRRNYDYGMCIVIYEMKDFPLKEQVLNEIDDYLVHISSLTNTNLNFIYLHDVLKHLNLPHRYKDCLAIYKDWANRPMIRNQ